MEFIIKHIGEIIGFLTFLGSFAGGLWFIFNYLSKNFKDPIKQVIDNQTAIFQKVDVFESKLDKVCKIVGYEFQKNGGGSSIDKIDRIEKAVNDISDRQLIDFYLDHQPKYECDVNGYCIRVNYKWRELTGLSEEDALGNQSGSPQLGNEFVFEFNGTLDITTNGNTFSLFGLSITQAQLQKLWTATCKYNGSSTGGSRSTSGEHQVY
jgi:hypothetical protein